MAGIVKTIGPILVCSVVLGSVCGCSWLRKEKSRTATVARGARSVGVKTARAGALVSRLTYRSGKRAVTWTGAQTRNRTAATLDYFGLIERPVPPDVLQRLPDELIESLTSLEFVKPRRETEKVVVASLDSRWEGELFYRLDRGEEVEVSLEGPVDLIVVTLASFPPQEEEDETERETAFYTVFVREDDSALGEVSFSSIPLDFLGLYGYAGHRLSEPGVFVIKTVEGAHSYRLYCKTEGSEDFVLISFYLPHYGVIQ